MVLVINRYSEIDNSDIRKNSLSALHWKFNMLQGNYQSFVIIFVYTCNCCAYLKYLTGNTCLESADRDNKRHVCCGHF
jgi:hypothetical protein